VATTYLDEVKQITGIQSTWAIIQITLAILVVDVATPVFREVKWITGYHELNIVDTYLCVACLHMILQ